MYSTARDKDRVAVAWRALFTALFVAGVASAAAPQASAAGARNAPHSEARAAHRTEIAAPPPGRRGGTATPGGGLKADDSLPMPPWWHGMCDGASGGTYPGSKPNGAVFDGLVSCGPGPNQGGSDHLVNFFPGAWGEFEWECVELSMRWMYQAWGVDPYGANGNTVVTNYPMGAPGYPRLERIANGTRGEAPQPGDVISVDNADQNGHTEVIAWSSVNSAGNGSLRAITENWSPGSNGWVSLSVDHWVVSDGIGGDRVVGWLHNPKWFLQLPVTWWVTPWGSLEVSFDGSLTPEPLTVATNVASAQVVGGQGDEPAPLVAALTKGGELEAGWVVPGSRLVPVARGVRSFSVSTGFGRGGHPLLAWVTSSGALEIASSLTAPPRTLIGSGVTQVELAPNSAPLGLLAGVVTEGGDFAVGQGSLRRGVAWSTVASGVSEIGLAGGGEGPSAAVEAYLAGGALYERQGDAGWSELATGVKQFSVATIGTGATPLLSYVTPGGQMYVSVGGASWREITAHALSTAVSGGLTAVGYPLVTFVSAKGRLFALQGLLTAHPVKQAHSVTEGGGAALVTS